MASPISASPAPQAKIKNSPTKSQSGATLGGSALQGAHPRAKADRVSFGSKSPKFGDNPLNKPKEPGASDKLMSGLRKTAAGVLGTLSAGGAALAIPLGLMQMMIGIIPIFHFLIYTGLATMALPVLGGIGTFLLWPKK